MSAELWRGATGTEVVFTAMPTGLVLIDRDALALLLVAAGFNRVTP